MKNFMLKSTAVFLLLTLLYEFFFPTIAFAVTSMQTQPEVWAYQPVDATDNVSLTNGKFNYTIPITSIPDYPMAIGYGSGLGMADEAGMFGFGFNGFSGAIGRNTMGLPDDLKNGLKTLNYSNQRLWDASVTASIGLGTYNPFPSGLGLNTGVSFPVTIGYNNYKGIYGAVGIGLGVGKSSPIFGNTGLGSGLGISLTNDSREQGLRFGAGAGIGIATSLQKQEPSTNRIVKAVSKTSFSESLTGIGFSRSTAAASNEGRESFGMFLVGALGKSIFDGANSTAGGSTLPPTYNVMPSSSGFGASLSGSFPVGGGVSLGLTFAYNQFKNGNESINMSSYGFMYLNQQNGYDRSKANQLADMTIEGENSYGNVDQKNSPVYLQRDFYGMNAMGLSGSMQLFQPQYGVVSRRYQKQQFQKFGLLGINTERNEVLPWTQVSQAMGNVGVDIISLLKKNKDPERDGFETDFFNNKQLKSLQTPDRTFDEEPVFRMRGDFASTNLLASKSIADHDPVKFSMQVLPLIGEDEWRFAIQKELPMYAPEVAAKDAYREQQAKEKLKAAGTSIRKYTIREMVDAYKAGSNQNANDPQSFFTQYDYSSADAANSSRALSTTNAVIYSGTNPDATRESKQAKLSTFNVLQELSQVNDDYMKDLIGGIEVNSTNGLRYFFNLPVFTKKAESISLSGNLENAPVLNETKNDFHSVGDQDRGKLKSREEYNYPYAWLLTGIVGDDYIDFDAIPGPSDGDIGFWVKFKYVRTSKDYRWRSPFTGLTHSAGVLHDLSDDNYSATSGTKEIYYLSEIESANYICKYELQKRLDGLDAKALINGPASNSFYTKSFDPSSKESGDYLGNNSQFLVSRIDLYKKHHSADQKLLTMREANQSKVIAGLPPSYGYPIKSTVFEYDYSTSSGVVNHVKSYKNASLDANDFNYLLREVGKDPIIGTGKLTLRKVYHIAYTADTHQPVPLPSYQFNYPAQATDAVRTEGNPAYDEQQVDMWGNYAKNAKSSPSGFGDFYQHYTELSKKEADKNAQAFQLREVILPGGGKLQVEYEAQAYGWVQDKKPYVMRNIVDVYVDQPETSIQNANTIVKVDITDLNEFKATGDPIRGFNDSVDNVYPPLLRPKDKVYGEVAFYQEPMCKYPSRLFMSSGEYSIKEFKTKTQGADGRYYQEIVLENNQNLPEDPHAPFVNQCRTYMYTSSTQAQVIKKVVAARNGALPTCDRANDPNLSIDFYGEEKSGFLDALRQMKENLTSIFVSDATHIQQFQSTFNTQYGSPAYKQGAGGTQVHYAPASFLRTPVVKGKYTGASVKSIKLYDNFMYATKPTSNTTDYLGNVYGTEYAFADETNYPSGVATLEPGGGKSCVIDNYATKGIGFMPSPAIVFSRAAIKNSYARDPKSAAANAIVSRDKGQTVYEFYTAKDHKDVSVDDQSAYDLRSVSANRFKETFAEIGPGKTDGYFFLFFVIAYLGIKIKLPPIIGKVVTIPIPLFIPLFIYWDRNDEYFMNSYSYVDYSDMIGRPRRIIQYTAGGQEDASQEFNYYGMNEPVQVAKSFENITLTRPGMIDQAWSEAYYTRHSELNYIPPIFFNASTSRDFAYTTMKYTYLPSVLKSVKTTADGVTTQTENSMFDYYTGTPVEVRSSDSYKNYKVSRIVPAYWKYAEMGPSSANAYYSNNLVATAGSYQYLVSKPTSRVEADEVTSVTATQWSLPNKQGESNKWSMVSWMQPKLLYNSSDKTYAYGYTAINNHPEVIYTNPQGHNDVAITSRYCFKPLREYVYGEVDIDETGRFRLPFNEFDFTNYVKQAAKDNHWKLITDNQLYAANGSLVQSQNTLDRYVSQLLGYNISRNTAVAQNAAYREMVYDGAENTYPINGSASNGQFLEGMKLELGDARVLPTGTPQYQNKVLSLSSPDFADPLTGLPKALVVKLKMPDNPIRNVTIAKLDVTYSTGIKRSLYMSVRDDGTFQFISNTGEIFTGFYVWNRGEANTDLWIIFNPKDFPSAASMNIASRINKIEYTVSNPAVLNVSDCKYFSKNYKIPTKDVVAEAHTGQGVFALAAGTKGTRYAIKEISEIVNASKVRAEVWVHRNSPQQAQLVISSKTSGGTETDRSVVRLSDGQERARVGNWILLRKDIDLSQFSAQEAVYFSMRNAGTAGMLLYDDIRILPYYAEMNSSVYDQQFDRLISTIDKDNFSSFMEYDARGRMLQTAIEIAGDRNNPEGQRKTVQRFMYNDQRKP